LGQLLKITPAPKKYIWQKLKPLKHNIITKQIIEPSVAIMVETHLKLNKTTIEVDN
jgi:ribosome-associated translation inhibitor RaiA